MHRLRSALAVSMAAIACVLAAPRDAHAGKYDLDLTPLGSRDASGNVVQDDAAFRSLSSELGNVVSPKPMDPADSLGLSGFSISSDFGVNTISGNSEYWKKTAQGGADNVLSTVSIMGRKGLYPGIEIGGGANHVFDSRMWAMVGYGKVAFHEGFHHLPIPSIALRGSFGRLLGATNFNLTTAAPAIEISHVFGLGKTFSLTPYVGYEALIIISRSQVLDATPNCDEFADAYNETECPSTPGGTSEFVFKNSGAIVRHRPHLGLRMIFSVMRLGFEAMFVPPGSSTGKIEGRTVADNSKFQTNFTFSVGLDF